jgi:hypothetical protein
MASTSSGPIKRGMRDYTLNLDGVNEQHIDTDGDFFHIQSVSVGAASILLRFDDGPQITRQQGEGNRVYYSRVSLTASAACVLVIQLGYGYATDSRASIAVGTISTPITPALHNPAVPDVVLAAGVTTAILAADPNRLGCLVGLDSTQPNAVRIADAAAAAGAGLKVEPGQTVPFFSQDALSGFNPGGAGVTVTVTKFMKT